MILSKVPFVDFLFDLKNWRRFDSKKYSRIEIIWKITILIGDTSSFMVGIFRCHVSKLGGVSPSSSWAKKTANSDTALLADIWAWHHNEWRYTWGRQGMMKREWCLGSMEDLWRCLLGTSDR